MRLKRGRETERCNKIKTLRLYGQALGEKGWEKRKKEGKKKRKKERKKERERDKEKHKNNDIQIWAHAEGSDESVNLWSGFGSRFGKEHGQKFTYVIQSGCRQNRRER